MQTCIVFFLFNFLITIQCQVTPEGILDALESALNFVHGDYKNFNVDGVFGVTLAEGVDVRKNFFLTDNRVIYFSAFDDGFKTEF